VSKDVESRKREGKTPMTFSHAVAMTAVGVVGILVAFWILSSIAGVIFFFVKVAVIVAAIAGVFWLVSRLRH
jgi:high-affinity Fe2+/Pb2+ permease